MTVMVNRRTTRRGRERRLVILVNIVFRFYLTALASRFAVFLESSVDMYGVNTFSILITIYDPV
jgi:hypothetical protein